MNSKSSRELFVPTLSKRFNRLNYPQKFTLISFLFILPLIAFVPIFAQQIIRTQQYGYAELYGAYTLQPLQDLLEHVQEHNRLSDEIRLGLATVDQLEPVREKIQADFEELKVYHDQYAEELRLTSEYADLNTQWMALVSNEAQLTEAQKTEAHLQLEISIQALIRYVGDTSFLILDPDLDTYYLMDVVLLKLPKSQTYLNQIRVNSAEALKNDFMTSNDRTFLLQLIDDLKEERSALEANLATSLKNNASGKFAPVVAAPLQEYLNATDEMLRYAEETIKPLQPASALARLNELTDTAQIAHAAFYDATSEALLLGINDRIIRYSANAYIPGGIALISVLFGFWFGLSIMRRISRPLSELAQATEQMASGDLSVRVQVTTEDEVGQVGQAFNEMGQTLQASQTRLAKSAEVSRRLSTLLDPDQLVLEVVEQIKSAFHYYQAQIYLLDKEGKTLNMVGGTGEAGQSMLESGHSLSLERGLVGRAARTKNIVLIPDTRVPSAGSESGWLPNPLLSETRAEIAVPITLGAEILGVLNVQHNVINGLTPEDADLLQSIANQVAIALQNARQYIRAQTAVAELSKSEAKFRAVAETANDGIVSANQRGEIIYFNRAAEKIFGYEVEEVMGKSLTMLMPEHYRAAHEQGLLRYQTTGEPHVIGTTVELAGLHKLGDEFPMELSLTNWQTDEGEFYSALIRNISERKTVEEALARRTERDRVLTRISTKIRTAVSVEQILQVATQEMRQAVGAARSVAVIEPNEETMTFQPVSGREGKVS